jgi:hypothetical protein
MCVGDGGGAAHAQSPRGGHALSIAAFPRTGGVHRGGQGGMPFGLVLGQTRSWA